MCLPGFSDNIFPTTEYEHLKFFHQNSIYLAWIEGFMNNVEQVDIGTQIVSTADENSVVLVFPIFIIFRSGFSRRSVLNLEFCWLGSLVFLAIVIYTAGWFLAAANQIDP